MDITQHVMAIALHVNIISFNILIHYLQTDSDVPVSSDVVPLPTTFPQVPPVGTTMTPPSVSTMYISIDMTQHVIAIDMDVMSIFYFQRCH
jgi:hypothetical protein